MARPRKEGLDYFPHDTDATNDEKVETLRLLYGNDGYAFFFILLERIYRTKKGELDISDPETIEVLVNKIGVKKEKFEKMLRTSFNKNCFDVRKFKSKKVLTSAGIKKRMRPVLSKRLKNKDISGIVSATETPPETIPIGGVSGELQESYPLNKSKEKNIKDKTLKDGVSPEAAKKPPPPNLIDYFFRKVSEIKKFKPVINGGKDGALTKAFLKSRTQQDGEALIDWFLTVPVSDKLGSSIGHCFSANIINQWLGAIAKGEQGSGSVPLPHERRA